MFPRNQMPMRRGNPDQFFFGSPNPSQMRRPQIGPPRMPMRSPYRRQGGGGGLLQRILGKKQQQPAHPFQLMPPVQTESRGIMETLANPEKINSFLSNTQKVLETAQQIKPVVEQYGPMVKNFPMLWKLYKGFRDLPSESDTQSAEEELPKKNGNIEAENEFDEQFDDDFDDNPPAKKSTPQKGASRPKLYV